MSIIPLVGRILMSVIFIMSGMGHFLDPNILPYAAKFGVPAWLVYFTGAQIVIGGLMVLLGFKARIGAGLLFIFLPVTALVMHQFWNLEDPMWRSTEMAHFMKNIALAGASLFILYFGAGPKTIKE